MWQYYYKGGVIEFTCKLFFTPLNSLMMKGLLYILITILLVLLVLVLFGYQEINIDFLDFSINAKK